LGVLVGILVVAAGCNSDQPKAEAGKVIAKGRILKNGLPLKPSEKAMAKMPPGDSGLEVIFIKLGTADAGEEIRARILDEPPGTFDLIGAEGKGIPPGRYRVAITLGPFGSADELKGKYSRDNSKIDIEVKPGEDVVIDLANYP
jgi:hypothetical protein